VQLTVSVGAKLVGGARNASLRVRGSKKATFPILPGEAALHVRLLVDRSIAEFFLAGGRAVYTTRVGPQAIIPGSRPGMS